MTHLGYLIVGWGVSIAVLAFYAFSIVRRGSAVAAQVPAERRRWISTDDIEAEPTRGER